MKPAPFDYVLARSAAEAEEALAHHGDAAKVLAGGQSLVPLLNFRLARPGVLVDINGARELDAIAEAGGELRVGALARLRALERWAAVRVPLVAEALRLVGHPAIRVRGTVVGSLVHADPAAELPALLLCLDGAVVARSARGGERLIGAERLYVAPLTTTLRPDELAVEARFRLPSPGTGWGFAAGSVALLALGDEGRVSRVRLGFFGVGGVPVRGGDGEATLVGQAPTPERLRAAGRAAAAALQPDGDLHATAEYRRRVAAVLAERTLTAAVRRCQRAA